MMEQFDQTLFSENEPIYEQPGSSFKQGKIDHSSKKYNKKLILLVTFVVIVLVISIFMLILINTQTPSNPTVEPTPISTPSTQQQRSHLDQLFFELDQNIKQADPLENILPYPPVETNITVSPSTN